MKTLYILILIFCSVLFASTLFSQAVGDYRSNGTGNWSNAGIWQKYTGTIWGSATTPPTGSETITIRSTDSVYINVVLNLTGTLKNEGKLGGTSNLTVASGGTYSHDQNGGSIPVCTWEDGSICQVTGYISGSKPNNLNQDFYHFKWLCSGQTSTVDLAWYNNTIRGDITFQNPNGIRTQMTSPTAGTPNTITILGNIYVLSGHFTSNGSSSLADITVNTYGNIIATGDPDNIANTNFSISRGSAPTVTWNLYGDTISLSNVTTQNSANPSTKAKFIFAKQGEQTIILSNVAFGTTSAAIHIDVASGSILNLGTTVLSGTGTTNTGSFRLLSGATLVTAHPGGINGNIQCTGETGGGNFFAEDANYVFNGTEPQVTGTYIPTTVNNLTIDNPTTVALSRQITINGVLRLKSGVFDNTIPFTLGPNGSISYEGGSLLVPVSVQQYSLTIPQSFFVDQNYPNPFNPSTTIRFGLPNESFVSVKVFNLLGQEVSSLFEGRKQAGIYELNFNASNLVSGTYFYRVQTNEAVDIKQMMLMK